MKELLSTFIAALDEYSPQLLKLCRERKGTLGQEMKNLLNKLDEQTSDITAHRKNTSLQSLPLFVCEDSEKLFRKCLGTDPDDEQTKEDDMVERETLSEAISWNS